MAIASSSSARAVAETGQGAKLTSIGPLTFGPDGTLFAADNQVSYGFTSRAGAASGRPQLIVMAVPEPGSLALLVPALGTLFWLRRRTDSRRL